MAAFNCFLLSFLMFSWCFSGPIHYWWYEVVLQLHSQVTQVVQLLQVGTAIPAVMRFAVTPDKVEGWFHKRGPGPDPSILDPNVQFILYM